MAVATEAVPRAADALHHDLLLPSETRELRAEVRRFATEHVAPEAGTIAQREESPDSFPTGVFGAMAQAGLFGIPFAAAHGGRGLAHPVCGTVAAIEELAYVSSSVAAIYDVHCILAGHALALGSEDLRRRYLAPLIAGELVGAFATTEPEASTDLSPRAVETVGRREGDAYVIDGRKRFITNAPVADFVVTLCRTGEDELSLIVVDTGVEGVQIGAPDRKLGNRGQLTADVVYEGARAPGSNVIGEPGRGLRHALQTLTYGRVGIAASGVGLAQAAFDHAVAHLRHRRAFGQRLAQFQHWQFRMAERATELENARNLYAKAALRLDGGESFPEPEAAMAKHYATALAVEMARDAIQVFGGYGFMRELAADGVAYPLEAIYRDAKIAEIYEGTNEIQKLIIARTLFGKDMTG